MLLSLYMYMYQCINASMHQCMYKYFELPFNFQLIFKTDSYKVNESELFSDNGLNVEFSKELSKSWIMIFKIFYMYYLINFNLINFSISLKYDEIKHILSSKILLCTSIRLKTRFIDESLIWKIKSISKLS